MCPMSLQLKCHAPISDHTLLSLLVVQNENSLVKSSTLKMNGWQQQQAASILRLSSPPLNAHLLSTFIISILIFSVGYFSQGQGWYGIHWNMNKLVLHGNSSFLDSLWGITIVNVDKNKSQGMNPAKHQFLCKGPLERQHISNIPNS